MKASTSTCKNWLVCRTCPRGGGQLEVSMNECASLHWVPGGRCARKLSSGLLHSRSPIRSPQTGKCLFKLHLYFHLPVLTPKPYNNWVSAFPDLGQPWLFLPCFSFSLFPSSKTIRSQFFISFFFFFTFWKNCWAESSRSSTLMSGFFSDH